MAQGAADGAGDVLLILIGYWSNSGEANAWYAALERPSFQPPGWAFGAAWTTLYTMMGIALAVMLDSPPSRQRNVALLLFGTQLALNFAWSPLFFGYGMIDVGLLVILAINVLVTMTIMHYEDKELAAAALPYFFFIWLVWCGGRAQLKPAASTRGRKAPLGLQELKCNAEPNARRSGQDMNGAAGTIAGMGREAEGGLRDKMREWVGGLDMVSREEFDAVKAMAAAARDQNDALEARIAALAAGAAKPAKPKPASKTPPIDGAAL